MILIWLLNCNFWYRSIWSAIAVTCHELNSRIFEQGASPLGILHFGHSLPTQDRSGFVWNWPEKWLKSDSLRQRYSIKTCSGRNWRWRKRKVRSLLETLLTHVAHIHGRLLCSSAVDDVDMSRKERKRREMRCDWHLVFLSDPLTLFKNMIYYGIRFVRKLSSVY